MTSPSAVFDVRFLDIGIHPGGGHLFRLATRVGAQGAAAMALCGDTLSGEEAVRAGLAWRCVPDDDLERAAGDLARRAASRSRELVMRTKATLLASVRLDDPLDALALERDAQEWSMQQPDFVERVERMRATIVARRAAPGGPG
jgi:enoyl-CoA hydratase